MVLTWEKSHRDVFYPLISRQGRICRENHRSEGEKGCALWFTWRYGRWSYSFKSVHTLDYKKFSKLCFIQRLNCIWKFNSK